MDVLVKYDTLFEASSASDSIHNDTIYPLIKSPILDQFENCLSFNSLRTTIEAMRLQKIQNNEPFSFKDVTNWIIGDDYFNTLLNPMREVKIGNYIHKYVDFPSTEVGVSDFIEVVIPADSLEILYSIRTDPTFVDYDGVVCRPAFKAANGCLVTFQFKKVQGQNMEFQFTPLTQWSSEPVTYEWNFGDGFTSNVKNPIHAYNSDGQYTVCLTIVDALGCVAQYCQEIEVDHRNSCNIQLIPEAMTNLGYMLQWTSDDNGSISEQFFVDWGDGGPTYNTTHKQMTHHYSSPGTYNVCVTVQNNSCNETKCTTIVVTADCCSNWMNLNEQWNYTSGRKGEITFDYYNTWISHKVFAKVENFSWKNNKWKSDKAGEIRFDTHSSLNIYYVDYDEGTKVCSTEKHLTGFRELKFNKKCVKDLQGLDTDFWVKKNELVMEYGIFEHTQYYTTLQSECN